MGRPDECATLLLTGKWPFLVAAELGISTSSVLQYLFVAVGRGKLMVSDILLSFPEEWRVAVDNAIDELGTEYWYSIYRHLRPSHMDFEPEELKLYIRHRSAVTGDLFFYLTDLEEVLHRQVELVLKRAAQETQQEWWGTSVPRKTRDRCQHRMERDPSPSASAYSYTDFGDLVAIIREHWGQFFKSLPPEAAASQQQFLDELQAAILVRNRVMHPVRHYTPTEGEFRFICALRKRLAPSEWQLDA